MNKLVIISSLFILATTSYSQSSPKEISELTGKWDAFVQKHVKGKGVDYSGAYKDIANLKEFINAHKNLKVSSLDDNSKKAIYINLYNATMIYNIFRYADAKKIKVDSKAFTDLQINDISIPGGNIWSGDYKVNLEGQDLNLDNIEHQLIRGKAEDKGHKKLMVKVLDPRIHAAVNCAAKSCPPVINTAYTPENIDSKLESNMNDFLSAEYQFSKVGDSKIKANSIVFWYYEDFDDYGKQNGMKGAGDYLSKFFIETTKDRSFKIKHLKNNFNDRSKWRLKISTDFSWEYDWKINDIRNFK